MTDVLGAGLGCLSRNSPQCCHFFAVARMVSEQYGQRMVASGESGMFDGSTQAFALKTYFAHRYRDFTLPSTPDIADSNL